MQYQITFHELVWKEDLSVLDKTTQKRIFKAIMKKLPFAPKHYGKSLKYGLKNMWALKVGDYRVIYSVKEQQVEVFIIKVGFRRNSEAYLTAARRLLD
ncbi:MAG: type II toxin-antitoxin system RelE/ParE family toxin [Candidatus Abawacabacteria bacterium]|nr:type II toxin-antitoxin system RelE/ParE family toxin [Candidatus Abawacabacteria bacterium]